MYVRQVLASALVRHPASRAGLSSGASLLLATCQGTMSLEEAKKVTASFQGGAFVPPPRTITDVSTLLERHAGTYREQVAADRAAADRQEPAGLPALERVKFYQDRGLAASRIGRSRQWIEDLTMALELARGVPAARRGDILMGLSVGELLGGRYADAARHRQEALEAITDPASNVGRRIALHGSLAFMRPLWAISLERIVSCATWTACCRSS